MCETVTEQVLLKRFDEVNVYFRTTWDLYLKFYTVFLTFDLAALGWVYGQHFSPVSRWPVAVAFISQNLFVVITSAWMVQYSKETPEKILEILKQLAERAAARGEAVDTARVLGVDLPLSIATWGGMANCAGMVMLTILWILWWRNA